MFAICCSDICRGLDHITSFPKNVIKKINLYCKKAKQRWSLISPKWGNDAQLYSSAVAYAPTKCFFFSGYFTERNDTVVITIVSVSISQCSSIAAGDVPIRRSIEAPWMWWAPRSARHSSTIAYTAVCCGVCIVKPLLLQTMYVKRCVKHFPKYSMIFFAITRW